MADIPINSDEGKERNENEIFRESFKNVLRPKMNDDRASLSSRVLN
jgi:hypothetical protein